MADKDEITALYRSLVSSQLEDEGFVYKMRIRIEIQKDKEDDVQVISGDISALSIDQNEIRALGKNLFLSRERPKLEENNMKDVVSDS